MNRLFESIDTLFESNKIINENYDFNCGEFESKIPHNMRFKTWDVITNPDSPERFLYWVTQEDFSVDDLKQFAKALEGTPFKKAAVTVRDLSCYDYNGDTSGDEDVMCMVDVSNPEDVHVGQDYQNWYDRVNSLSEDESSNNEEFSDEVVTDPYDLGFTEEDLRKNLNLKFTEYSEMTKEEHKDFPECNSILNFDVYYGDTKVGETQCYGSNEDSPEDYFSQVLENIIGNPIGMDFSVIKLNESKQDVLYVMHDSKDAQSIDDAKSYLGNYPEVDGIKVVVGNKVNDDIWDIDIIGNKDILKDYLVNDLGYYTNEEVDNFIEVLDESKTLEESPEYCLVLPDVKSDDEINNIIKALKDLGYESYSWTR